MERVSIRPTDGCEGEGIASDASRRKPVCRGRPPAVTSARSADSFEAIRVCHGDTEYQVFMSREGNVPVFRAFPLRQQTVKGGFKP